MILIHTALQCEAQCIIEYYKLKKTNSQPKIYSNEDILVLIGGIGKDNTLNKLTHIFTTYSITKAINLGIAGCSDLNTPIGSFFTTLNHLIDIEYKELVTVDLAQTKNNNDNMLYDMEASYFLEVVQKYLTKENIEILKIVSDHLDNTRPNKESIKSLIRFHLDKIVAIVDINK